jgi:outer membrane protein assembly factor BamB
MGQKSAKCSSEPSESVIRRHVKVLAGALAALGAVSVLLCVSKKKSPRPAPAIVASARPAAPAAPPTSGPADAGVSAGPPRMLHLDPLHTNRSPYVGPTRARVAWTFDTGGPIQAAPAMLGDDTIVVASLGGKLHGVTNDGKARFTVNLEGRIYSSPLVTDEGIFVGSDAQKFFGVRPAGSISFRLDTDGDADTGAALAPWGGMVFASGKIIYAALPNGTLLWRFRTRRKSFSSPAVGNDGTVYVGSQDRHIYAILPDGKLRWRVNLESDVDCSPAIGDDGTVFVGTDRSEVVALAPDDGRVIWRTDVGGFVRGALSIGRKGTVLVGTYGPTPRLLALDPKTGTPTVLFGIAGTGAVQFGIHGGPVEDAAGRLYFGTQDDFVYALGGDGQLLWKFQTQGDVDAPLVITPQGRLLAGSDDGTLYAFEGP